MRGVNLSRDILNRTIFYISNIVFRSIHLRPRVLFTIIPLLFVCSYLFQDNLSRTRSLVIFTVAWHLYFKAEVDSV